MAEMPDGFPARPVSYDKKVGLVLQGGGALGSYQAGVYEALASSEYLPDWAPGSRSAQSTPHSSPAIDPMTVSDICALSGTRSPAISAGGRMD